MPRDYADHPKLKGLTGKHRKTAVEHLEQMDAKLAYEVVAAELEEAHQIRAELPAIKAQIATLTKQMDRPVTVEARLKQPAQPRVGMKRPDLLKCVTAGVVAEFLRRAKQTPVDDTLKVLLPEDTNRLSRQVAKGMMVSKSATDPGTTTAAGFAAELVRSDVLAFWSKMAPISILGELIDRALINSLEFGDNRSLNVPHRGANDERSMRPAWIAEGATIPVLSGALGSMTLYRHKLAAISAFSNELADTSIPNIAAVAEQFILDDLSTALDEKFMSTDAPLVAVMPAGVRNGITGGTPTNDPVVDVRNLIIKMVEYRARRPVVVADTTTALKLQFHVMDGQFVFKDELEGNGTVMGIPLVHSVNAPANTLTIMDGNSVFALLGIPEIDLSSTVTLAMADAAAAAPTKDANQDGAVYDTESIQISDAATTVPPTEVRSMFQTNSTAIRTVLDGASWNLMHPDACAWVDTSGWT
ncbi:phage major capsid protein [Ruegeria sp. HKCCD5849]|uniref:phage major capsid protein n=1 Tax=unclassified Ruegeria TaxID=2625375 RepID=UPI001491FBDB|nr:MULTISPECIES: phage major capsid protein [unclassified Ruegeria]NOD46382.1 phage major capsid protein [Ruegeria sp. HKCCD5849]NOD50318.1 phage major capsid protein [Ruegeria sp. HKCCD5851]